MRRGPERPIEHRLLLTATLCLLAAGAVMVYSASSARDLLSDRGDGTSFLVRYLLFGAIGFAVMQVLARRGLESVRRATPVLLVVSLVLLVAVLVPGLSEPINGARRWIGHGPVSFQPSEIAKLALILYAAELLSSRRRITTLRSVSPVVVVAAVMALLVAVEPDLGTALVIGGTTAAILVAAGMPLRHLALLTGAALLLVALFAMLEPYRRARLTAFLDPWADAGGTGFQIVQGEIALGSGGLLGTGLGQSVQKVFYLPEAHTDFILAVIGEEFGVAGILIILTLYGMIAYAGLRTARAAKGAYAKLLASGLTSLILCQAALNVFAVLGLAPLTGVPLPFVSYGPSNLIVLLAAVGLILNIAAGGSAHLREVRPRETRSAGRSAGKGRSASPGRRVGRRRAGTGGS